MWDLIIFLAIGLLAGLFANALMGRRSDSLLMDVILGVVGAVVGGWLVHLIGFYPLGFISNVITATLGAIVVIWLIGVLSGNNKRVRF